MTFPNLEATGSAAEDRLNVATSGTLAEVRERCRALIMQSAEALPWRPMLSLEWTKFTPVRLYAFHCSGFHKIGFSEDPDKRLFDLQSASPFEISKVFVAPRLALPYAKWAESLAHHALGDFRERREWFRVSAAEAIPIIKAARWLGGEEASRDSARRLNAEYYRERDAVGR